MRHDFGYFEEDRLNKVGDLSLWRRILALIGPQTPWMVGAILLALVAAGAGLALPHLMRLAVDRYIVNDTLPPLARIDGLVGIALLFLALSLTDFAA
ncbi:MAG: ABC transporter ATP-binding protein, partial [Desulfobulbaceae bacterium]|nr:ABC transporter ATP-binding protein [Desulfobulbaceae bacterium]